MKKIHNPFTEDIIRYFKRSKLSLISLAGLFIIYTTATFAPFLANDKPLAVYMQNRDVYEQNYWAWTDSTRLLIKELQKKSSGNQQLNKYRSFAATALSRSMKWIKYDPGSADKFMTLLSAKKTNLDELKKSFDELSKKFHPDNVKFRRRLYLPVLRSLNRLEAFFILFFLFVCVRIVFFIRALPVPGKYTFILLSLIVLLSYLHPKPVFDPENYKEKHAGLEKGEWMIFPPVPFGFNENILTDQGAAPWWMLNDRQVDHLHSHWLGTDTNGRDVLCRMIWGSRVSMSVGVVSVGIYAFIGIIIGLLAGYYRGKVDIFFSRVIEIMICFPSFFLILTVMAYLKPSIINIMIVIGITSWPGVARLMRAEALRLTVMDFVSSAKALGVRPVRILTRAIFINGMAPVLVAATFGMADAILIEAALSFLGIGVPQPTPSWGDLMNNARNNIQGLWWLTVFPGLLLFLTVTAYNTVGETLRDSLDPRLKQ